MGKTLSLLVLLVITLEVRSQTDNKVVIGKIDSINSRILSEQRKIWIYTPDMTSGGPAQRWPVLYLLDGDAHFPSVVGMIQQMSQVNGNSVFPEMIVVGIPNTDRTRDLTPTHVSSDPPMMDSNFSKSSGGGENFVAFLEKELIPHIDSAYRTAPYRVLVGHSFGGLTVMNVLANHTRLFNAYVAIDPSMWYDRQRFLAATEKKLGERKYEGTRLFLGIANTMPDGMTLAKMKKDTSSDTRHIRSIFALSEFLKTNPQNGLLSSSKYYGDDNHGSVPLISEYDGLRYIFDYYKFNFSPRDFADTSAHIAMKFKKHYDIVSKNMGYRVTPPELNINALGYYAMSNKQYDIAASLFQLNIENYPNSGNTYDSYGDLLLARKDTANAIASFNKALSVQENSATRQKLNALLGKEVFSLTVQELQRYAGIYDMESPAMTITLRVKEDALWAEVPGEGEFQLLPFSIEKFTVKGLSGYEVQFHMDGNKVEGFTSIQPNGTFNAKIRK
jgi:predicted alpha/beta superfamily hydrolase